MKRWLYGLILSMVLVSVIVTTAYGVGVVSETTLYPSNLTRDPWGCDPDPGDGKCHSWSYFAKSWLGTVYGRETGLACQSYKFSSYYSCFRGTFTGNQLTIGYYKGLGIGTCWNTDQDYDTVNRHMRVWVDGARLADVHQGKTADGLAESKPGSGDQTVYEITYPLASNGTHTLVLCPAESSYYYGMGYMNFVYLRAQVIDNTPPTNPNMTGENNGVQDGVWTNLSAPVFTWSGATDDLAGVRGYDVYFGADPNGTNVQTVLTDNGFGGYSGFAPGTLTDGQYYLRVRTWDKADNAAEWTTLFTLFLDTTPPGVSGDPPTEWQNTTHVAFSVQAEDTLSGLTQLAFSTDNGGSFTVLASPGGANSASETLALDYPDGAHDVLLRAVDRASNVTDQSVTVRVDTAAPSVQILTAGWDAGGQMFIGGSASDATSGIKTVWVKAGDDGEWQLASLNGSSFTWSGVENNYGTRTLYVRVEDNAGNVAIASTEVFRPTPTPTATPTAQSVINAVMGWFAPPTATPLPSPTPTPTATLTPLPNPTRVRETAAPVQPTATAVLPTPTPQPSPAPIRARTGVVRSTRSFWQFLSLVGLSFALGVNAVLDKRPKILRRSAQIIRDVQKLQRGR